MGVSCSSLMARAEEASREREPNLPSRSYRWSSQLALALGGLVLLETPWAPAALLPSIGLAFGWAWWAGLLCGGMESLPVRSVLGRRLLWCAGVSAAAVYCARPWLLPTAGPIWALLAALPLGVLALQYLVPPGSPRRRLLLPALLTSALVAIDRRAYVGLYPSLHLALALLAAAGAALLVRRLLPAGLPGRWPLLVHGLGALALLWCLLGGAGTGDQARRSLQQVQGVGHKLVLAAWSMLDLDQDGSSPLLGGGDCDDLDPARHRGRPDVPGDGLDADCSGADREAPPTPPRITAESQHDGRSSGLQAPQEATGDPGSRTAAPPALLLITGDSLRADVLGAYGFRDRPTSPSFDALAARSVLFSRAYCHAPVTGQSLSTILTGTYGDWQARPPAPLGVALGAARLPAVALLPEAAAIADLFERNGFEVHELAGQPDAVELTERALPFVAELRKHGGLVWVHQFDPHAPYPSLPEFPWGGSPWERYLAGVARWDKVLGTLADAAGPEVTLVVSSDHGEAFGEHGVSFHRTSVYDEQLRVPLLVRTPGVAPASVGGPVGLVDLYPTLLELLGLPDAAAAPGRHGRSLVPVLQGARLPPWPYWASTLTEQRDLGPANSMLGLAFGRYKLVLATGWGVESCYDLLADPRERHPDGCPAPVHARLRDVLLGHRVASSIEVLVGAQRPGEAAAHH